MGVNRVDTASGEVIMDISGSTVTPETLAEGEKAYNSKGEEIVGTMKSGDMLKSVYDTDGDGNVDKANDSEKLGGMSLYQMYDEMRISSLAISGAIGAASCDESGVIVPKSKQLVSDENGNLTLSEVDYYPFESILWLTGVKRDAVITLTVTREVKAINNKLQLKLPIKYIDGTIVETPVVSTIEAAPSKLRARTTYTIILVLRGITFNNEGKIDEIPCWVPGVKADDTEKLDGLTHMDIVSESVASTGRLPRGICDENGVISPDEPWFEFDEESNIQIGEVTPSAYDFIWFASFTSHIVLSVKADIEPVDGKLPLKIKANFAGLKALDAIIDVPANSPLKADKTYHFIVDSRSVETIETEDGFKITGLKGAIIGLDPETDTVPTEDSTNLITSGAVYDVIGDINSILDNINGEVV